MDLTFSPIKGAKGNIEFLLLFEKDSEECEGKKDGFFAKIEKVVDNAQISFLEGVSAPPGTGSRFEAKLRIRKLQGRANFGLSGPKSF